MSYQHLTSICVQEAPPGTGSFSPQLTQAADVSVEVHATDSSAAGSEIESFVAPSEAAEPDTDTQDVASSLQAIQEQLAELRQLVKRNLENTE